MTIYRLRGIEAIQTERSHQVIDLNYTSEVDAGRSDELARAGACYADYAAAQLEDTAEDQFGGEPHPFWPLADDTWKPEPSALENIAKAGALLAAAYDAHWTELNG